MAPAVNRATGNDTMQDELAGPGPLTPAANTERPLIRRTDLLATRLQGSASAGRQQLRCARHCTHGKANRKRATVKPTESHRNRYQ